MPNISDSPTGRFEKKVENISLNPMDYPTLMMKVVDCNGKAYNDFQWDLTPGAIIIAPDWKDTDNCGNGLHGWIDGRGDSAAAGGKETDPSSKWIICGIPKESRIIDLKGKIKTNKCVVLELFDSRSDCANRMHKLNVQRGIENTPVIGAVLENLKPDSVVFIGNHGTAIAGNSGTAKTGNSGTATAGNSGTATAGDCGTATAGRGGTAIAGDHGTATAGNDGTATAGRCGKATAGRCGKATAGDCGTATAGRCGKATAGDCGTATAGRGGTAKAGKFGTAIAGKFGTAIAGDHGTATAGNDGTATAGDGGTATAGHGGTASAGHGGTIEIQWFDGNRSRKEIGYIGENGLNPNVAYKLDPETHKFVEAK